MGLRRAVQLCRFPPPPLRRPPAGPPPPRRGALLRPVLLGLGLGLPLAGAWYLRAERRERRRLRLLLDGVGRFGRSLAVGIHISLDYWWTANVALRGLEEPGLRGGDVGVPPAGGGAAAAGGPAQRGALREAGAGALRLQPPPAPRVRGHPAPAGGSGPAPRLPRGGRALPGGFPDDAGRALPGVRLRARGGRQPGPGSPRPPAGRHPRRRQGAVHRPAGSLRGRRADAGAAAAHRGVHAPRLRPGLGAAGAEGDPGAGAGLRERGPQRRALRPRPAPLRLRGGAAHPLGQVQQAGADGRFLRGLQDHQRGGDPQPGAGPAGRRREADPRLRRANLLHRLHPRGPAPRERAGAARPRRQSPTGAAGPRPLRVPERKGPGGAVPALESHRPARRRRHEDALGRAGRRGLFPLLRDPDAAAAGGRAAGPGPRPDAGGAGLHAGHGRPALPAHPGGAAGAAPPHAPRLPQHQHRPQHQRRPGRPGRSLLPDGQERRAELEPPERGAGPGRARQPRLLLAAGGLGGPQVRGGPEAGEHLHEADGRGPAAPGLLGAAAPQRAGLRVPAGVGGAPARPDPPHPPPPPQNKPPVPTHAAHRVPPPPTQDAEAAVGRVWIVSL